MTTEEILEALQETADDAPEDEPLLLADGFEDALLGTLEGCGRPTVLCYDYDRCIEILIERDGMTEPDAHEWMSFNVVGSYVGKTTPLWLHNLRARPV